MITENLTVVAMVIQIRGLIWIPTLALMRNESCPRFGPLKFAVAPPNVGADTVKGEI
jgi:hypothetical protein